jgi:hypothetical protein
MRGPQGVSVLSLLTHPTKPGTVYAATDGAGIIASYNYGKEWIRLQGFDEQIANASVQAIVAVQQSQVTLYAGTWGGGVFRSMDDGESWEEIPNSLAREEDDRIIRALAVDSETNGPPILYAGTNSGRIFRIQMMQDHWKSYGQLSNGASISSMVITDQGLLVGTDTSGLFMREFGETDWKSIGSDLEGQRITILAIGSDQLYAGAWSGIYTSNDNGITWRRLTRSGGEVFQVKSLSVGQTEGGKEILYIGTQEGAYTWNGDEFHFVNNPLLESVYERGVVITSWAIDEVFLYAGTSGLNGIYRSPIENVNIWETYQNWVGDWLNIRSILIDSGSKNLLVGTWGSGIYMQTGKRKSEWINTGLGLNNPYIRTLVVSPIQSDVYAGTWGGGIFQKEADGEVWQAINQKFDNPFISAMNTAVTEKGQEIIYAGTWGGGIYATNNGVAWYRLPELEAEYITTIAIDSASSNGLYVGTRNNGVYFCPNECEMGEWEEINDGLPSPSEVSDLIWAGRRDQKLYALVSGQIYKLSGTGEWKFVEVGGSNNLSLLSVDARNRQIIYAISQESVSYSQDGGRTWRSAQSLDYYINALAITHQFGEPLVCAGTVGGSVKCYSAVKPIPSPILRLLKYSVATVSVLVLAAIGYVYIVMLSTKKLRFATVLWLVIHPLHLFVLHMYREYSAQWNAMDPLEQIIMLQLSDEPYNLTQLEKALQAKTMKFDSHSLADALAKLAYRGFIVKERENWKLIQPLLARIHSCELSAAELDYLMKQASWKNPQYIQIESFFSEAEFHIDKLTKSEFLLSPEKQNHLLAVYDQLYVRIILGRPATGDDFDDISKVVQKRYDSKLTHRIAIVIIDWRPEPGARYRLCEIRQRDGLAIVPLDIALFSQVKPNLTAVDILSREIDQATGQQNLYAISGPVVSDLSFFGREPILQEVVDWLNAGQPVGVFGLRKVGKTSLIQRLQGHLTSQRPVALVDTQKTVQQRGIWSLYPDIIAAFVSHLQRYQPEVDLPNLRLWPVMEAPSPAMADTFMHDLQTLHIALGEPDNDNRLLLIVDEIDRLLPTSEASGYEGFATLFGQLRAANQQARMLDFLVVGVDAAVNRVERWRDRDSELYRALREVWMPPMAPDDVCEMIESLGSQMRVCYKDEALHLLACCGGGQPFVTRQMCGRAVEGRLGRGAITVTLDQAQLAVEEFIFDDPYLGEMWRTRLGETQRGMLRQLAQASEPLPRLELLPASQRQEALAALSALEDYTLVRREEGRYIIAWDVFEKWIRWVELGLEE